VYQVYQVYQKSLSRGGSLFQEFQVYQVYQVCQVSEEIPCYAREFRANSERIAPYYFGRKSRLMV